MVPLAFWPVRGAFGERNGCHVNVHRKVHGRSSEKLFVTRLPIYSAYRSPQVILAGREVGGEVNVG